MAHAQRCVKARRAGSSTRPLARVSRVRARRVASARMCSAQSIERRMVPHSHNILSLYGERLPYNVCRNLEVSVFCALARLYSHRGCPSVHASPLLALSGRCVRLVVFCLGKAAEAFVSQRRPRACNRMDAPASHSANAAVGYHLTWCRRVVYMATPQMTSFIWRLVSLLRSCLLLATAYTGGVGLINRYL